jgi:hypothetical protein
VPVDKPRADKGKVKNTKMKASSKESSDSIMGKLKNKKVASNKLELVNEENKALEDKVTKFNRRKIKAKDEHEQNDYVKKFVLRKTKEGGRNGPSPAIRVANTLQKSKVIKGKRQLLLPNNNKKEEPVGGPFYNYGKLHSTKKKKIGKSKGEEEDEDADGDAVASGSTLVFEGEGLKDALERIDGLKDLLAEIKPLLEAKWGFKEGTLELIDMHVLYELAFRAHQDTNDGEPNRVITAVVNLSEDRKKVPGVRIYGFGDHSYQEKQGTVISFHSDLVHKSLHYASDAEEEAGGQQGDDDDDDTGMKLTFFFGLVGEDIEGTMALGGFLGGRNRKKELFEELTTTSQRIYGLGEFASSLGDRDQFFFRRVTEVAEEEDGDKFDSSTLGRLYLLTRSQVGAAEAYRFNCRSVPEEVAKCLLPEFYVYESTGRGRKRGAKGRSSSGGRYTSNFLVIENEEIIGKGEEEVSVGAREVVWEGRLGLSSNKCMWWSLHGRYQRRKAFRPKSPPPQPPQEKPRSPRPPRGTAATALLPRPPRPLPPASPL